MLIPCSHIFSEILFQMRTKYFPSAFSFLLSLGSHPLQQEIRFYLKKIIIKDMQADREQVHP
jgi:hypothetical protein